MSISAPTALASSTATTITTIHAIIPDITGTMIVVGTAIIAGITDIAGIAADIITATMGTTSGAIETITTTTGARVIMVGMTGGIATGAGTTGTMMTDGIMVDVDTIADAGITTATKPPDR